jgi:hypothetical protein
MTGATMAKSDISPWFRCPEGSTRFVTVSAATRRIISFRKANKREEQAYAKTFG